MNHLETSFFGKNAFWRYLLMITAVFAASNLIGGIPLILSLNALKTTDPEMMGKVAANPGDLSFPGDPNLGLLLMLFPFIAGLAAFILLIKPLNQKSTLRVINGTGSFRWKRFFIPALVWLIISAVYLLVNIKVDPLNFSLNNISGTLIPLILISLFMIPFQTAFEEIIFRGYMMQGFTVIFNRRWFPLIMTSLLFALMHAMNPEVKEFGFWTMMPQYMVFGLLFGIITILDDGIEAAMGVHTANNAFLCIMVTNESSALQTPALFEQHNIYPWAEFTTMLIMGSLLIIILGLIFKWRNLTLLFGEVDRGKNFAQVP